MNWCTDCAVASPLGQSALVAMVLTITTFVCLVRARGNAQQLLALAGLAFAAVAVGTAIASGMIGVLGVVALLLFGTACYYYRMTARSNVVRTMAVFLGVSAVVLATHRVPGFHGLPLLAPTVICEGCQRLWLLGHMDKPFVGLLLFAIALNGWPLWSRGKRAHPPLLRSAGVTVTTVAVVALAVMGVMSLLSAVRWAPKAPDVATVMMFLAVNLFFTTFAEEVFFRMFLHDAMRRCFPKTFTSAWRIIAVSTALFGLAHIAGGPLYVLGALLAGIGYGYVYEKTQRIEWAIAAHFGVNVTHFFLFSYPRLAP